MANPRVLLVTEKHNLNVTEKDPKGYILEAVFAQFGVKNNNNRIYEESEYLPHLTYLLEQIKGNNLVGELDHPEKFDISLKNASHVIENLYFDKASHQVKGRIRLLDTDAGLNAQKLIDGGVQLSISSRSAGIVESDNRVKLRRIFTFDIVNNPGFANAQLNRVNESYGFSTDSNAGIDLYDYTEKCSQELLESLLSNEYIVKENKETNSNMNNTVTTDQLDKYSQHVSTEFSKVTETIQNSNAAVEAMKESYKLLEEKFNKMVDFTNYISTEVEEKEAERLALTEKLSQVVAYSNYLSENLTKAIEFSDYLSENLTKSIEYSEYIAENNDSVVEFTNYLAENLAKSIEYSEYIAESNDSIVEFSNYLAENLKLSIEFSEQIAESALNESVNIANYATYLGNNLEKGILYSEHVAQELTESQSKLEDIEQYASLIGENAGYRKPGQKLSAREARQAKLNENFNALLATIEKQNTPAAEDKYKFTSILSDQNKGVFESLEDTKKQKVASQLSSVSELNESLILECITTVTNESEEPTYMKFMPESTKALWEKLDEGVKSKFILQANWYNPVNEAQTINFWETRELEKLVSQPIVENASTAANALGYSQAFLDYIKNSK